MDNVSEMRILLNGAIFIRVKHLEGSSQWKAKDFDSWKDFWIAKTSKDWPESGTICSCCQKEQETFVGAHVIDEKGNKYIYPTCSICNKTYGEGKKESPTFVAQESLLVPFNEESDAVLKDS